MNAAAGIMTALVTTALGSSPAPTPPAGPRRTVNSRTTSTNKIVAMPPATNSIQRRRVTSDVLRDWAVTRRGGSAGGRVPSGGTNASASTERVASEAKSAAFAGRGARVVIASRKLESCEQLAAEIRAQGGEAIGIACHVGRWDTLEGVVDAVEARYGKLDVLMATQENAALWRWWEKPFRSKDVKGEDDRFRWKLMAYRNIGGQNHWLQLKLRGAAGNRQAIGAHATLVTPAGRQSQVVGSSDSSYFSQGHYRLYFGLGEQTRGNRLEIRWPDGHAQTIDNVKPDQLLEVVRDGQP